jgi:hypothetical protein
MSLCTITTAAVAGIGGTLAMDLVAAAGLALHAFRIPAFSRWFLHALRGTFRHADIDRTPPARGEGAIALPLHYATGICLAAPYLLALDVLSMGPGNVLLATAYGISTAAIPLLLMLPGMGYGLLGLRHRGDTTWLRQILLMHLAFGAGIGMAVALFVSA